MKAIAGTIGLLVLVAVLYALGQATNKAVHPPVTHGRATWMGGGIIGF